MKKFFVMCLIFLLLVGTIFSGCSKSESGNVPSNEDSTTSKSNVSSEEVTETTKNVYADITWDSEEISWKKDKSPANFTIFVENTMFPFKTWGEDDVSKEITKRTGVSLDLTVASDNNQLNILIASDSLPEFVWSSNNTLLSNPDVCYSWDGLISEYTPEFLYLLSEEEIFINTQEDGHFYTIFSHYISKKAWDDPRALPSPGTPSFGIREDIMEKMGNPVLESVDDLMNVFASVKKQYPEMIVYLPYWAYTSAISDWMGVSKSAYEKDGRIYNGINNPDWLEYYKYMNKLYVNKYITQETFTYQPNEIYTLIFGGNVFSSSINASGFDYINQMYDQTGINGKFKFVKPLKVNEKIKYEITRSGIGYMGTFITKNNKNPERAIKFIQFLKSPEGRSLTMFGIEGVHYTMTENGLVKKAEDLKDYTVTGIPYWYFQVTGLDESISNISVELTQPEYSRYVPYLKEIKKYVEVDPILGLIRLKDNTDEQMISIKINEIITNSEVPIITAQDEEELISRYNKMMKDLDDAGIKKLEEYMTYEYNESKDRYEQFNLQND